MGNFCGNRAHFGFRLHIRSFVKVAYFKLHVTVGCLRTLNGHLVAVLAHRRVPVPFGVGTLTQFCERTKKSGDFCRNLV